MTTGCESARGGRCRRSNTERISKDGTCTETRHFDSFASAESLVIRFQERLFRQ